MASDLNRIFKDIELLVKLGVPFDVNSEGYNSVNSLATSPRIVPAFQDIINAVSDIEVMQSVPWFCWVVTLCSRLVEGVEALEDAASVTHIAAIRATISKLVAFAIMPNLTSDLPYPSLYKNTSKLSTQQRRVIVALVVRVLLKLLDNGHSRQGVLRHYGEVLGSLISLHTESRSDDDRVRLYYRSCVTSLLDDINQSTVFTHLMILHTTKGDGGRVSRIVRKVLETKLQAKGGVAALIGAALPSDQSPSSTQDIAKISNLLISNHNETFYQAVLPQVVDLLKQEDVRGHRVAAGCIMLLQEKDPTLCERYVTSALLAPLERQCCDGDIERAIESLRRWVDASCPETCLSRPLPLVCLLYASIVQTPSPLKSSVSELLHACLDKLSLPCPYLLSLIFPPHPGIAYSLTPSCTVVSTLSKHPLSHDTTSRLLLDFIAEKKLDKLKVDYYRALLRCVVDGETPLDRRLISSELLTELSSDPTVVNSLSTEPRPLIDFLLDLFTSPNFESDSISLGLVLLTVFLSDNLIHKKANWEAIAKLETPLLNLKKSAEFEISTLAGEVLARLYDVGIIKRSQNCVGTAETKAPSTSDRSVEGKAEAMNRGRVEDCDFEEAYKDSMDPLLPVRAHALRMLSKLLLSKDKTATKNKTTILCILKANLDHSDSYLYLSAIEGLSSLASVFPDEIINILCDEFTMRTKKPDLRLKLGQVMVKTINHLGEMGAVYKKELLSSLLSGIRDPDPLVRASSLSNIGEICKILSFRVYDSLTEIFDCVERLVDTEKEVEPRRAALMLITLLLQGLGKHTFTVLEEVLPQLYRKLKRVHQSDSDEVTRLHAQLALEQLSETTRSLIFPQSQLIKKISIVDINK